MQNKNYSYFVLVRCYNETHNYNEEGIFKKKKGKNKNHYQNIGYVIAHIDIIYFLKNIITYYHNIIYK